MRCVFDLRRNFFIVLSTLVCAAACSSAEPAATVGDTATDPALTVGHANCEVPNTGCPCEEGATADCGHVTERFASYVTCSMGTRSCEGSAWGACVADRVSVKSVVPEKPGSRPQTLGSGLTCPSGFDDCDPYCNATTDTPGGFTAGSGFTNTPAGLTLTATASPTCTSLTLSPSTTTVTLTGSAITGLSASPVTFTLTANPAGCVAAPFATTWTIDKFDRATITGSNNQNGSLSLAVPIAGPIKITAFAAGQVTSTNINVKVNVLETPTTASAAAPNKAASASQISAFGTLAAPNAGFGLSSPTWLYPYPNTYFPLALPAPIAQYRYTLSAGDSTSLASAVKVSLRYPTGVAASASTFNYSLIMLESNAVTCAATPAQCNMLDPQVVFPQLAWNYFEQTARGQNAELIVQRLRSGSNALEPEVRLPVHFVRGQLKGTVFYQSYSSPKGGNQGAILSIAPGATSPTLAVQPNGTCTTCHTINSDGSRLISNGGLDSNGNYTQDVSNRFDNTSGAPAPATLNTYTNNRFSFGAPYLDGTLYMTHSGETEWHSPSVVSNLYKVSVPATPIAVTNWPSDMGAVSPRFSIAGDELAFGFWGGSSLPCAAGSVSPCTGSPSKLPSVAAGTRLAVVDWGCSTATCTSASTGWKISNARNLTPGVSQWVAWPTFTPDGDSVAYQRQYRSSNVLLTHNPSDVNSVDGALAELWISDVPATGATTATPTRLSALNGLSSAGVSFLPQQARTIVNDAYPLYNYAIARHEMGQTITSGSGSPPVTLVNSSATGPFDIRIDIVAGGALGTATFRWSSDGGTTYSATLSTAATVSLGSKGIDAVFPSGTYNATSNYQALVGRVGLAGTPTGGPWDFRLKIVATGALGTATFKYSSDGGSTYSSPLTTAAAVSLGSTGLVASFANVTYSFTAWAWGAFVSHYHQDNAQFQLFQTNDCTNNVTQSGFYDYRTNYYPSFAPTTVDGEAWLVFTTRRMYGNIASESSWDGQPTYACTSGETPAKKLWISAIDSNWSPGTDPSHPAFYLPGQELAAGNSEGNWVSSPCTPTDGTCNSSDDCCGGSGAPLTSECRVTNASVFPPVRQCKLLSTCAPSGASCTLTSDCCTGLTCPSGGGLCVQEPPKLFTPQTNTREYVANCPTGTFPKWRFLEWQSTVPSGTNIAFSVQTKNQASDAYLPASPLLYATATQTTAANQWQRGTTPMETLFAGVPLISRNYLLVSMVFTPNSAGSLAPTLTGWRQLYDCVPAE